MLGLKKKATMRRTILLLSTMAVGLLLASGVALAASQTFTNSERIRISSAATLDDPAKRATPYPSEISVSGFGQASIRDVNLTLSRFSHTFPDDVGVLLVGPGGQKALLMSDVGCDCDVSNITLILDDEAANPLPDNSRLAPAGETRTYKPTQGTTGVGEGNHVPANFRSPAPSGPYEKSLSVFDGTNPNGTWQLFVLDDSAGDNGKFGSGWSLQIRAS